MDYMYRGEVNISQDQLAALLKAAESLQIKGLSDNRGGAATAAGAAATKTSSSDQQSAAASKHNAVPANKSGLTIEHKQRPISKQLAAAAAGGATESDVSMSREG